MLNLNQLRIFYFAAKNLSMTKAAQELCITQPAVTAQIKLFEKNCSLKLFKKKGRNILLTNDGQSLFEHARRIFEYEKKVEAVIDRMKAMESGILRLGAAKTFASYFIPELISSFRQKYPEIQILLSSKGSSLDKINSLLSMGNEVAIIAKVDENPRICFTPFSWDELVVILAPSHHLAQKKMVAFRELAREPVIMKEVGSGTRKLVDELFSKNDCEPKILMEMTSADFIKKLVQRGEGISFLMRESVSVELKEGKLATLPLSDPNVRLEVNIAYLKDEPLTPAAEAFRNFLLNMTAAYDTLQRIDILKACHVEDVPP
jgi:DNA-binding transcriptional LysR family regulator